MNLNPQDATEAKWQKISWSKGEKPEAVPNVIRGQPIVE